MHRRQSPPRAVLALALAILLAACADALGPGSVLVSGLVLRGPTQPVCIVDQPCDAPFAAGFTALQGSRTVTHFQSDTAGHFLVRLDPGTYTIVTDAGAPVLGRQSRDIQVPDADSVSVTLTFDTGIR